MLSKATAVVDGISAARGDPQRLDAHRIEAGLLANLYGWSFPRRAAPCPPVGMSIRRAWPGLGGDLGAVSSPPFRGRPEAIGTGVVVGRGCCRARRRVMMMIIDHWTMVAWCCESFVVADGAPVAGNPGQRAFDPSRRDGGHGRRPHPWPRRDPRRPGIRGPWRLTSSM